MHFIAFVHFSCQINPSLSLELAFRVHSYAAVTCGLAVLYPPLVFINALISTAGQQLQFPIAW